MAVGLGEKTVVKFKLPIIAKIMIVNKIFRAEW